MTNDTLIDERELREVLRPLRPEPEAYEEAVRARLAEREKRLAKLDGSPFLRQAAALLPPGMAPLLPATAAGKKVFAQLAATLFAMPVLVLAMTGVTFVAALRSLRRLDARHVDAERPLAQARRWWRAHPVGALVAMLLFLVLGLMQSIDLLMGLVLVSMVVLTWVLRKLSDAGLAGRTQVGAPCGYMLILLAMGVSPVRELLGIQHAELQGFLVYTSLFAGGMTCFFFSIPAGGRSITGLTRIAALLIFLPLLAFVVGLQLYGYHPRTTGMTRAELVEYAENTAPRLEGSPDWRVLREVALWLEETGSERLDLTPSRTAFRDALNRGEDISNFVLGDAADLGWIEDEDWASILEEGPSKRLLASKGKIPFLRQARASLHGLVETGALGNAERNHLANRLVATWNAENVHAQLELLNEIVRDLELIGRADRLAKMTPTVHAALTAAWMPEGVKRETDAGGFALYYRRGKDFANGRAALEAVWLMARLGVPAEIDLARVREHLRGEATRNLDRPVSSPDVEEALALAALEHDFVGLLPEEPAPTPLHVLLDWRLTIGVFLLVGLCVYATLRAPVTPDSP